MQAAAAAAQAAAADHAGYISELEAACQSLLQQLDASLSQHGAAHAAVEAAADRLAEMADAREALEQQLVAARQELAVSAAAAQRQEAELRAELQLQREAAERLEARLGEAEAERGRLAAEAQQFMAQNAELQEAVQVCGAVWAGELEAIAASLHSRWLRAGQRALPNPTVVDTLRPLRRRPWAQALQAECAAMHSLGARVEAENSQLVDNMCDMTGGWL